MKHDTPSTWCPLPWISVHLRTNGHFSVCCHSNSSITRGLLRKEDRSFYRAADDSIADARNSPDLRDIRVAMMAGRKHPTCVRCHKEELIGMTSRRQVELKRWEDLFPQAAAWDFTASDGSINAQKVPILSYDLRMGNRCNLKCRTCDPAQSTPWIKDHLVVFGPQFSDTHGQVRISILENGQAISEDKGYAWFKKKQFWEELEADLSSLQHLFIAGGEPMLIQEHFSFLEKIAQHGIAKNISLEYNSNITTVPEKALRVWKEFREVSIGASIDGTCVVNEYIRYPSRWDQIEKNLKILEQSNSNLRVWISTTVQIYNLLDLPDLVQWRLMNWSFDQNRPLFTLIRCHPLHIPDFLNIQVLPKEGKRLFEKKLEKFNLWLDQWIIERQFDRPYEEQLKRHIKKNLDYYSHYMNQEDWSHLLPKFWKYTQDLDQLRGQKFQEVLPEIYDVVESKIRTANSNDT